MPVVAEQALGNVQHSDVVVLGLFGEGEDKFVAGAALGLGGLAVDGFEALEQVVCGEVAYSPTRIMDRNRDGQKEPKPLIYKAKPRMDIRSNKGIAASCSKFTSHNVRGYFFLRRALM